MIPRLVQVFLLLILILSGCGPEKNGTENLFSELPEYTLEVAEVLGDQGDLILGRPVHAEIDSEGNRLVMDLSVYQVRVYDRDGVYQNSFGSEGDGPGEFRQAHHRRKRYALFQRLHKTVSAGLSENRQL